LTPPATVRTALAVVAGVAVAAGAWAAVGAVGDDGGGPDAVPAPTQEVLPLGPQGVVAQFVVECRFSHAGPDDPIVFPGEPGASHRHHFFGATTTDAHSTPASLRRSPTTCQAGADTAAYWAPALYVDGEEVEPTLMNAYYRPGPGVEPEAVQAHPAGLAIIAGDPTATTPQPLNVVGWHCGASPVLSAEPPTCAHATPLALRVTFPDCWDGERLDSDDHRSHMALSREGRCPASHPVAVPQLVVDIHYPVSGAATVALASGTAHSAHADFFNGWDQEALEREVAACINRSLVCGVVSNRATG
jgi:hypothetical protein